MVVLIQHLRKSLGRGKECSQNPTELGQRLDWMLPDKILSTVEDPSDREFWRIPKFMLSDKQRKTYGTPITADDVDDTLAD